MTGEQAAPAVPRPPRYKQALVTWLGVYPALTLTLFLLGPAMESWPLPLRTLLVAS
jgi:antibiotic biosynthesis monooxygenase (ABM) superfamily enzyme